MVARGILVPGPGFEPASPALKGVFLTTGPPGKLIGHPFSHRSLCPQGLGKSSLGHLELSTECEIPKFLS